MPPVSHRTRRRRAWAALATLACAAPGAAGCPARAPARDAAQSDASAAVAPTPDASTEPDAPPPSLLPALGGRVSTSAYGAPLRASTAAAFWDELAADASVACTTRNAGACTLRACVPVFSGGAGTRPVSAGTIRLTTEAGGEVASLTPGSDGYYRSAFAMPAPWSPGDRLAVEASGGELAPFRVALETPPALVVTDPRAGSDAITVDRAAGITVRWVASAAPVRVALTQGVVAGLTDLQGGINAECTFAGGAEQGTIPAAMLADFTPTPAGTADATLLVYAVASRAVTQGTRTVLVIANSGGQLRQAVVR